MTTKSERPARTRVAKLVSKPAALKPFSFPSRAKAKAAPPASMDLEELKALKARFDEVRKLSHRVLDVDDTDTEFYDTKANILSRLFDEVEAEVFEPITVEERERAELTRLLAKYGNPAKKG